MARAKAAQDVLGDHQDAFVAEEEIRAWSSDRPELESAAARLVELERARRVEARRGGVAGLEGRPGAGLNGSEAARRARP